MSENDEVEVVAEKKFGNELEVKNPEVYNCHEFMHEPA